MYGSSDVGMAHENNGLGGGLVSQGPSVLLASSVGGGRDGEECWAGREEKRKRERRGRVGIEGGSRSK